MKMEDAMRSEVYLEDTRKHGVFGVVLDLFSFQNQTEAHQLGARDGQEVVQPGKEALPHGGRHEDTLQWQ